MRTARITNPLTRQAFPSFVHNTTTYVGIPHDHPSLLFVQSSEPALVTIQACGCPVFEQRLRDGQVTIELSNIQAPPSCAASPLTNLLAPFARTRRPVLPPQRLYKFSVVLHADSPSRPVLATYDFHVLCPEEYDHAYATHLRLRNDPSAISPDTISQRAEGTCCPHCRQVRETQER